MKVSTGFCCPHSRTTMGTEHAHTGEGRVEQVFRVGILMCSALRVQNLLLRLRAWEKKGRDSLPMSHGS